MSAAMWTRPYVDLEEWRVSPEPHWYLHGGFAGTDTRFSFYLPKAERWQGRFVTAVEGGQAGHEARAAALTGDALPSMSWAFATGAYLVESNGGHIASRRVALTRAPHPATVTAYEATAAATRYASSVATRIYGRRPDHGYIVGGSGGGRALLGLENCPGVWDGAVQYTNAAGHGVSLPALIANVLRLLGPEELRRAAAAWAPGGDRNPFQGLDSAQRQALSTLYRAGFAPGGEWQLECPGPELGVVLITKRLLVDYDPGFFRDFWSVAGYPGADGSLDDALVVRRLVVREVVRAGDLDGDQRRRLAEMSGGAPVSVDAPVGLRGAGAGGDLLGADLFAGADGSRPLGLTCLGMAGDVLLVDFDLGGDLVALDIGTELLASNRDFLAYCYSYLHQVDSAAPNTLNLTVAGVPVYPQRMLGLQDVLVGLRARGDFDGRVIYVGNLTDSMSTAAAWPVIYADRVRRRFGDGATDRLRVWLNDNATHIQASHRPPGQRPVAAARLIDWIGSVEQALLDLIAWCEDGVTPPRDTAFEFVEGRMCLPSDAERRGGLQPVVDCHVDGGVVTQLRVGEHVTLVAAAEVPPGAGTIIAIEWDLDGSGEWAISDHSVDEGQRTMRSEITHRFAEPGTYFPAVRVTAHRQGDRETRHGRVPNLARVRVDVT